MEELGICRLISHGCGERVENIEQECEDKAAGHWGPGWRQHITKTAFQAHQGTHHIQEATHLAKHCPCPVRLFKTNKQRLQIQKYEPLNFSEMTQ